MKSNNKKVKESISKRAYIWGVLFVITGCVSQPSPTPEPLVAKHYYSGFDLGPDGQTIYYLTGGPIFSDGKRVEGELEIGLGGARGLENLHLVTYNIPNKKYIDHGAIFYTDGKRPTWVNSIAIGSDGNVYTLARFKHNGKVIEDLIKIPDSF